jgi:serine/threonine-protein kinase/endoribonuclease IRE1
MDIFSLGCLMHYCLTGGQHPFGGNYERDTNIMRGQPDLTALAPSPEAVNVVRAMLSKNPTARPTMAGVLAHPFWWGVEQRLQFLVDVSDRWGPEKGGAAPAIARRLTLAGEWHANQTVPATNHPTKQHTLETQPPSAAPPSAARVEFEDREPDPRLLTALEGFRPAALGPSHNWGAFVSADLIVNLGKYRRYDYTSLRDLLRVVRNKKNHFREMPEPLQRDMGPVPEGFYRWVGAPGWFRPLLLATQLALASNTNA